MKYGFVLPYGDARQAADFASEAEQAGWDGFFVWEPVWGIDAWVALTAAAMRTERIRLGTLLSPISRMRPWELASKTATLDHLSGGRVILSVGLGAPDTGYEAFGEEIDRKVRAELMDEGLDILTGLWRGQPFSYEGKHYTIKPTTFSPPPAPVQQPRIPIWVVGAWGSPKSMSRALRYDGLLPSIRGENGSFRAPTAAELQEITAYITTNRKETTPLDIIAEGQTPGDDSRKSSGIVQQWIDAGATWWIEAMWNAPRDADGLKLVEQRIRQGPPGRLQEQ